MRRYAITGLALFSAACWTPGPLQQSPALYPSARPQARSCIIALQPMTAAERVGKVLCNEPPEATGPPVPVQIGTGMTWMYRPHRPSVIERVLDQCMFHQPAPKGMFERYGALLLPFNGVRISRAAWAAMPADDRTRMIWQAAIHASCGTLRPVRMTVHIRDEQGRVIHRQRVATEFECHGEHASDFAGRVWHRCLAAPQKP